jgi:hypothetical protein
MKYFFVNTEMELILDLVLEYVDVETLLNCMFLSKHVHSVVMRILNYEISLLNELNYIFDGDIYKGIVIYTNDFEEVVKCLFCTDQDEFVKKYYPLRKNIKSDLMTVYSRLYRFDVELPEKYGKVIHPDKILEFLEDFGYLVDKYYYKMSLDLLGIILLGVFIRHDYCYDERLNDFDYVKVTKYENIIKCILDKGFNVNQLINMGDGYETTILNFALIREDPEITELILDKNPDVFMFDEHGNSADKLFIYRTTGDSDLDDHINSDNEHMVYLSNKFDKIKHKQLEQKKTNIWKK